MQPVLNPDVIAAAEQVATKAIAPLVMALATVEPGLLLHRILELWVMALAVVELGLLLNQILEGLVMLLVTVEPGLWLDRF